LDEAVFDGRMQAAIEKQNSRRLVHYLTKIGDSQAVAHFLSGYAKPNTKRIYSYQLARYFTWLKEAKGVGMTPDELITDNLRCVFETGPIDVQTKRRHTAWMNEYVNVRLLAEDWPENARANAASVIKKFYETNDSALFGDFHVSSQDPTPPPPALRAEDIRLVLKSMPLAQRLPLLFVWQGGVEINRVLGLTWAVVKDEYPLKLQFYGRKRHKKPYHTFIGRDSVEGLKIWREEMGSAPRKRAKDRRPDLHGEGRAHGLAVPKRSPERDGRSPIQTGADRERRTRVMAQPLPETFLQD
jgi:hypothetical protein